MHYISDNGGLNTRMDGNYKFSVLYFSIEIARLGSCCAKTPLFLKEGAGGVLQTPSIRPSQKVDLFADHTRHRAE